MRTHLSFITVISLAVGLGACAAEEVDAGETDGGTVGSGGAIEQTGGTGGSTGGMTAGGSTSTGGTAGSTATGGSAGSTGGSSTAGMGGSGGSTGGMAGTGGSTGGMAGTGGSGTGGTGGMACLDSGNDTDTVNPALDCSSLAYASTDCGGSAPQGAFLCDQASKYLRAETATTAFSCLNGISVSDDCSTDHDDAAQACFFSATGQACETPPLFDDVNMTDFGCQQMAEVCSDGSLDQEDCEGTAFGYTLENQALIFQCYVDAMFGECANKDALSEFSNCVFSLDDLTSG